MFQYLISKLNEQDLFPFYVVTPNIYAIGTASETLLDVFHKTNKKVLIIKTSLFSNILGYKICNNSLFERVYKQKFELNKVDKFFRFLFRTIIEFEFIIKRSLLLIIKKFLNYKFSEEMGFPMVGVTNLYSTNNYTFNNFHEQKYELISKFHKGKNIQIKLDIENYKFDLNKNEFIKKIKYKKYICIHVRDSNYKRDKSRRTYRNSHIKNYLVGIKYLINQGYFVIRLGDDLADDFKFTHKNYFDYAKSKIKDDLIDLYLIKNASFIICTHSGIFDTARLFQKPILITNMVNLFASYPHNKNTRGIFKLIKFKQKKMTIKDYVELPYYKYLSESPSFNDLQLIENTSKEITNAIKEFENLVNTRNFKLNKKQKKFNILFQKKLEKIYKNEIKLKNNLKSKLSQKQNLKMIRFFKSCEGCFTKSYLKDVSR